jgi:hypothetical protein
MFRAFCLGAACNFRSVCKKMKGLTKCGVASFGIGIAALALTFASGFGPCGPGTPFGGFLISLGIVATIIGSFVMVGAILRAAFGRRR